MPVHDWTRVDAGIFHAFHHSWIEEIARALNRRLLPPDYYALPEQVAVGLGPDVLTLQGSGNGDGDDRGGPRLPPTAGGVSVLTAPQAQPTAETDMEFYRRKQNMIAVRHVSGDRVVAIIEIVSPGNKAARNPLRAFVAKAAELLSKGVHLLVVDVFPPGRRDPQGIHSEIWQEIAGQEYEPPADKPLTVAAYDAGDALRAYVRNVVTCSPKTGPGGMRVSEAPRGRETNHEATHGRGGHRQAAPGRGRPGPGPEHRPGLPAPGRQRADAPPLA